MRSIRSVRVRVTIVATLVVAAALGAVAAGIVWNVDRTLRNDVRGMVEQRLEEATRIVRTGDLDRLRLELPLTEAPLVQVFGPDGEWIAGRAPEGTAPPDFIPVPAPGSGHTAVEAPNGDVFVLAQSVVTEGGTHTVVATTPLDTVRRSVGLVVGTLLWALPLLVGVVAGVAWVATGRALRPIDQMRAEADAISHSTLDRRLLEPETGDEVSALAVTLNEMLDRIEEAARRRQEFVSDASHELRSPVASVRTQLEVALLEPDPDWNGVARDVLADSERLERLIDDLLLLAKLDEEAGVPSDTVDLGAVVRVEAARPQPVPVAVDVGGTPPVAGDAAQLERVVRNLVDNAARHAVSAVEVGVRAAEGAVEVRVDDDGPGIPLLDRERVFERFVRLDDGRGRRHGGAGLGLALVRRIVRAHGGTVTVGDAELGGARFDVRLPALSVTHQR